MTGINTDAPSRMTNVNAMNMAGADGYSLSPEAILQWLNRRLGNRDETVRSLISEVETQDLAYKNLSQKIQALQTIRSAMMTAGKSGNDKMKLGEIQVEWNGESMSAAELLNRVGITDLATAGNDARSEASASRYFVTNDAGVETEIPADRIRERDGQYQMRVQHRIGVYGPRVRLWVDVPDGKLRVVTPPPTALPEYSGDMQIRLDALTTFKEQIATQQQTVNTGRDMLTTRLQSEIQARSQDITLGTQMMRNVNDSRAAILRNIR